jgi:sterol carrier protein 2
MGRKVYVIGVGMTKFEKPGSRGWDYPDMAKEAGEKALADAGVPYDAVEQAAVGYCYGDSTCGQRAVYQLGLTGIPVYNVNNNCATGSTALFMAKQLVEGGLADCVLALGFEKMEKGSLGAKFTDRTNPLDKQFELLVSLRGFEKAPPTAQFFGNAAREHMERHGTTPEQFARIGHKNHRHSVNNPYSQFQDEYALEDILAAPMVYAPLTKLQCCPTSDGAAAAILASESFVRARHLERQAVEIAGMAMTTDSRSTFEQRSCIKLIGADMTRAAAERVYEQSGLGPENIDVIELHDCFSANELITYEALGLCPEGKGGDLIDSGAVTYGGRVVVNPSGGLISKGHPLGATGLAQCAELTWQLRGEAAKRQVPDARVGLQHNLGLGGAAVVTMYRRPAGDRL